VAKKKNFGVRANPVLLAPFDKKSGALQVIIETPKGSRNKYAFDESHGLFLLKRVLPAGMAFPYDFGFVPRTRAEDGDPLDVLVLMDEPAFVGCLLQCRIIGIIEGEQGKKKEQERNDRVVAIEMDNHSFADLEHVDDLGNQFVNELEAFFVNYHDLSGEKYRILGARGPKEAQRRIKEGMRTFQKKANGKGVFSRGVQPRMASASQSAVAARNMRAEL
jgi:inorganic pyrophosphatase